MAIEKCPYCGQNVYGELSICSSCGNFIETNRNEGSERRASREHDAYIEKIAKMENKHALKWFWGCLIFGAFIAGVFLQSANDSMTLDHFKTYILVCYVYASVFYTLYVLKPFKSMLVEHGVAALPMGMVIWCFGMLATVIYYYPRSFIRMLMRKTIMTNEEIENWLKEGLITL